MSLGRGKTREDLLQADMITARSNIKARSNRLPVNQ
jgi:hypothetical protein